MITAAAIIAGVSALVLTVLVVTVLVINVVRKYLESIRASKVNDEVKFVYSRIEDGNYVTRAGVISSANLQVSTAKVWKSKDLDPIVKKSLNNVITIRD